MSVFYGWKISALSLSGNFMLQGSALYAMNAFMEPLCEAHGWSRLGVNFSLGVAALAGQIAMPIAALVSSWLSLRLLMTLGALIGGLSVCAMGYTDDIRVFTIFFIFVWVASQFCGGVVANALMSNWFSHFRGIALGIANSGTSLSGIILPFLLLIIIEKYGLQTAYLSLGLATCVLAPLCLWIVRRDPHMLHLHADGRKHDPRSVRHHAPVNTSLKALVHQPAVWFIGISFGLGLMCASGIISQLKPRFADLGLAPYSAMLLASVSALFATLAKYLWGWICDRVSPVIASRALFAVCLASLMLLALPANFWTLLAFGVFFSIGSGGLWVVLPAVVAAYFGYQNFLGVYKLVSVFIFIRCLGFPVMGMSHEYMQNYMLADIFFGFSLLAAIAMMFLIKPEKAVEK